MRGLVVGKFMPLHRGHQFLIEAALDGCDELTVVVYETFVDYETSVLMPISKRVKWINDLYGTEIVNLLARKDIHNDLSHEEKDKPEYAQEYADDLAFLGKFDKVFSSEDYGEPFAKALGAEHVMVDRARDAIPVSGTEIRNDLFNKRKWVDDSVYRTLIQKVVFVGTESTGKSTLAQRLAADFNTKWVDEYGRTFWEAKRAQGIEDRYEDFWHTGKVQYETEENTILDANRYLFCDTNAWTTYQWSLLYYGTADEKLKRLAYDTKDEYIWFLCGNEFGWVNDGSRELGHNHKEFQITQGAELMRMGVVPNFLRGDVESRVRQVKNVLQTMKRIEI